MSNIFSSNERYARDIGFDYGNSNSDVQAELLNGLSQGLRMSCDRNIGIQISYVVDRLSPEAKEVLLEIAGMIDG